MKFNKLDIILLIKTKLTNILYIMAALLILIPICIVLITNITFGGVFSSILISISFILILIGKLILILNKDKTDKTRSIDIATFLGILTAFLLHIKNNF